MIPERENYSKIDCLTVLFNIERYTDMLHSYTVEPVYSIERPPSGLGELAAYVDAYVDTG